VRGTCLQITPRGVYLPNLHVLTTVDWQISPEKIWITTAVSCAQNVFLLVPTVGRQVNMKKWRRATRSNAHFFPSSVRSSVAILCPDRTYQNTYSHFIKWLLLVGRIAEHAFNYFACHSVLVFTFADRAPIVEMFQ